jgi:CHAT domain-containing protein
MEAEEMLASTRALPSPERLARLASTRDEAFALALPLVERASPARVAELAALRGERSGTFDAAGLRLCVGGDASRARLAGVPLEAFAWIHLAAHGYVDRDAPERSGVALAGSGGPAYDGFLTIEDVLGMRIDANLVVLSACDTARGEVRTGEGVESMATAFLYSGARGVVASLWQVDDRATAEIMRAFYAVLLDERRDESPLAALSDAKLAIRGRTAGDAAGGASDGPLDPLADPGHPFYWAAFVHLGLTR